MGVSLTSNEQSVRVTETTPRMKIELSSLAHEADVIPAAAVSKVAATQRLK
jgi:hypothetical protein